MTNVNSKPDWKAIVEPAAIKLLGEPRTRLKNGKELRWGNKGSFSVNTDNASFFDFENRMGGGVVSLVMHCQGLDESGAWQWLKDNRFIDADQRPTSPHPQRRRQRRVTPIRQAPTPNINTDRGQLDYGLHLWKESEPIARDASHPARKWLSNRNLIPPKQSPPAQIRYHKEKQLILCIMASLHAWGKALPHTLPHPEAVHAIAIDNDGQKRFAFADGHDDKRIYGKSKHCLVLLIGEKDSRRVNLCEGLADALAIHTHATGPTIATITTISKIKDEVFLKALANRETHLYSDADEAGQKASRELTRRINQHGGIVKIHRDHTAKDPAERSTLNG